MSSAHIAAVVNEIEAYRRGERAGQLSWKALVAFSGFSHVALWQKPEVREAFQAAKAAARLDATPIIKPPKTLDERIAALKQQIEVLAEVVRSYDEQWITYEYNMHRLGLDPDELRRPLDRLARDVVKSRRRFKH